MDALSDRKSHHPPHNSCSQLRHQQVTLLVGAVHFFPRPINPFQQSTPPSALSSAHVVRATLKPDPFYGYKKIACLCARFITHLFACPEYPPSSTRPQVEPPIVIVYALHRTKLHQAVTFTVLVLLQRLKTRCPTARRSSGHRLFISASMIASSHLRHHLQQLVLVHRSPRHIKLPRDQSDGARDVLVSRLGSPHRQRNSRQFHRDGRTRFQGSGTVSCRWFRKTRLCPHPRVSWTTQLESPVRRQALLCNASGMCISTLRRRARSACSRRSHWSCTHSKARCMHMHDAN